MLGCGNACPCRLVCLCIVPCLLPEGSHHEEMLLRTVCIGLNDTGSSCVVLCLITRVPWLSALPAKILLAAGHFLGRLYLSWGVPFHVLRTRVSGRTYSRISSCS